MSTCVFELRMMMRMYGVCVHVAQPKYNRSARPVAIAKWRSLLEYIIHFTNILIVQFVNIEVFL